MARSNFPITCTSKSDFEEELVTQLGQWVETEANFYGQTDETFLLWFVRGFKYDMDKCKKKMTMFYENRVKIPQWWANRDLNEEKLKIYLEYKVQNTQLNGGVLAVDFANYPSWFFLQLSPRILINFIRSSIHSTPIRVKAIVGFNCPLIVYTLYAIVKYILPPIIRNRIKLYRSHWDSLFEDISNDVFPDEYGGTAGSIENAEGLHILKPLRQ
ncbi:hypothetical protein CHUAL_001134 [Chamberlinius hualienensis]